MTRKSEVLQDRILVHAVGNESRQDDGLALHAMKILKQSFPLLTYKSDYQLYLEDVLEWCEYDLVWFLDASYGKELISRDAKQVPLDFNPSVHHLGPDLLASMAKEIYKSNVKIKVTELPGTDFSLGEGLSIEAQNILMQFEETLETHVPIQFE